MEGGIEEDNHKSKSPTAKPQVIKVEEEVGEAFPTMGLCPEEDTSSLLTIQVKYLANLGQHARSKQHASTSMRR